MGDKIEMLVSVQETDADLERIIELTGYLRDRIAENDDAVIGHPVTGGGPPGTRGTDLETIGAILVTVQASVSLVATVVDTVRDWLRTDTASQRRVKIRVGDNELEVSAATTAEQGRLVAAFLRAIEAGDDGRP
ncbi:hypothetical protein GCM10010435_79210 [Winogradskya consettensis]|uniref:Uncharacterized protein n=1 Tax=Winogradskya consettensis TaxID=113560 RepID=A0A919ST87_9ACTN|nr:hypothetical protein [Actinoplanes consettensis]GIM77519.1 hypothetical protein Aco04nite_55750 [Actinoplanes consettensis]